MPANAKWTQWIRASVGKYLMDVATVQAIPGLIEELGDRSDAYMSAPIRAEIRINGPFSREVSNDYFILNVDANVLVTSRKDGGKNGYRHLKVLGAFHEAMHKEIPIYKYGKDAEDDQSLVGCLTLRSGKNDAVRVLSFGQLDSTDKVIQNAVDAQYVLELSQ